MILIYNNQEIKLIDCKSFYQRLKGFMFTKNINHALLFNKCNSIHTFFMKENIDVIMLDKNDNILYYFKDFKRNKVILPKKNVYKTIETPSNYFKNIKKNTKIKIII